MAIENIQDLIAPLTGIAGNGTDYYINLGINIILSTIIVGIIILIIAEIFGKGLGESIKPVNAFFMALVINTINILGLLGLLFSYIGAIPSLILPLIVWIVLTKGFFSMSWKHAAITGIAAYAVSIFIVPNIIMYARAFIPI